MRSPRAAKKPHHDVHHGIHREDPYAWLRDKSWRDVLKDPSVLAPEIKAYLDQENAYLQAMMSDTEPLQAQLFAEMKARLKEDDVAAPLRDGPWSYYHRYEKGRQYPLHCRRDVTSGREEIILDVNELAVGHEFCRVVSVAHSPDHRHLAYTVDFNGSERFELHVRELATGKDLPDHFADVSGEVVWCNDSKTFYYTVLDEQHRPKWIRRHVLGRALEQAETVYYEADDGYFMTLGKTESHAWVYVRVHSHTTSEVHVASADEPDATLRLVEPRKDGVQYSLTHNDAQFFILLRAGDAKDGAFYVTPVATPEKRHWQPFLPHRDGVMVQDFLMLAGHLVRLELVEALPRIVVRDLKTNAEHTVSFAEAAYQLALVRGYEFETMTMRFEYSSMTTPDQVFDYDLTACTRVLVKAQEVPSGHDPSRYIVERLLAPARDGALVPVTLFRRKDLAPNAATPVLLYGYGSYGSLTRVGFVANRLSLVDRGIIYAVAHIRGGRDKGYAWYESAKVFHKKRTFHDFIDAAEHLVAKKYTRRKRIVAHGASAGGMLMGAVANMAPETFGGIVAEVPFVDVLTTMLDAELPLTPPEWPEWGNPITDKEAYEYIASYSPYDSVKAQDYPALLVLAGLTDPRVTYWEPAKWVVRLRELKTDDNLLLFDVNMDAGHGGASGRFDALKKVALVYAFVLKTAFPEQFNITREGVVS